MFRWGGYFEEYTVKMTLM